MLDTVSATCEIDVHGTRIAFHLPDPQDHIQKHILGTRTLYEQRMLEEIAALVPDGGLVVDAGANIGNHTVFFSKVLGAKVLSFEPNPVAVSILGANIRLNALQERVELHAVGLGETAGAGRIVDKSGVNLGMAQVALDDGGDIEIVSLDDIVGDRVVNLIKIDVEGMEASVLKGGRRTLQRSHPALILEAATVEELKQIEMILRPLGYRKIRVYNHTPTYLFKWFDPAAYAEESALSLIPPATLATLPPTTGIYAGMATVAGNEVALRATVMSLLPQIDRLFLYLNGFKEAPAFVRDHPKISYFIDEDGKRYGDAGKFWGLEQIEDAIYITCDDDIIYPDDFVDRMVADLASAEGKGVVAVHGSVILQPAARYYDDGSRAVFHFEHALPRRRQVHVAATNACVFHSSIVRMKLSDFHHPNMADIWLAEYLQRNRLPAHVVPRRRGWLIPIEVNRPTIYEQSKLGSRSAYDSSKRQDEVLSRMYPITFLGLKPSATGIVLDMAPSVDVAGMLANLNPGERDPVIFVVCDNVTDVMRKTVVAKGVRWEVHLLSRQDALSDGYRSLFLEYAPRLKTWKIHANGKAERTIVVDWEQWLMDTFPMEADAVPAREIA